jgi:hypothetical protein
MTQATIGIGSSANDGTGDSLHTAGGKINANFTELYAAAAQVAVTSGKTLSVSNTMTLAAGADSTTQTFPAVSASLAALGVAQTFTAAQTFTSTINKVTITPPGTSATLTIANGKTLTANSTITLAGVDSKTLTVNNNLTLAGTDSTVMTFPSVSASIPGLAVANTFSADQTFTGKINKITLTAPLTGSTITILDGKTLTVNKSITFDGTDSTTMTFPASSATIGGLGIAQTWSAINTFSAAPVLNNAIGLNAKAVGGTSINAIGINASDNLVIGAAALNGHVIATPGTGNDLQVINQANGQVLAVKSLTEVTTIAASAYTDTTIQIPAGAIVLGVSVRVTAAVTCTSTFTVGVVGSTAAFSTAAVAKTLNATDAGTKAGAYYSATTQSVRITPDTTPSDNTGRVRVTIHHLAITAPTS